MSELSGKKNETSDKKTDKTGTKLSLNNVYSSNKVKELETTRKIKEKIKDIIKKGQSKEYKPKQTQSKNLSPIQIHENSIFGNGFGFKDSLNVLPYNFTNKINNDWRNINLNRNRLNLNVTQFSSKSKQQSKTETKPVVPQAKKFNNNEDIKNGFNNYVAQAINNHEKERLFETQNGNFIVARDWYAYSQSNAVNLAATRVLKTLWHKFTNQEQKNKNKLTKKSEFVLNIAKSECILNNENKKKLTNLLADSKAKDQEEQKKIYKGQEELRIEKEKAMQEKGFARERAKEYIRSKVTQKAKDLIKTSLLTLEGRNVIINGKKIDIYSADVNQNVLSAVLKKIKSDLIDSVKGMEQGKLLIPKSIEAIANNVLTSVEQEVVEKINSEIESRKKVLKDFNDYVAKAIEKHNNNKEGKLYKYENQKLCLCVDNSPYDTKENLINALINHLAITFANSKNLNKHNPFSPGQFKLGYIEVLDDETKKKLDESINKTILDNLSKEFNDSAYVERYKFWSSVEQKMKEHKFESIRQIKKIILNEFIKTECSGNEIFNSMPEDQLENVTISNKNLDYILNFECYDDTNKKHNKTYYYPDFIDSNTFDQKLRELEENYGEKNISPVMTVCFLLAIKKDDLTSKIFEKVLEHSVITSSIPVLDSFNDSLKLIENLQDNCYMPDKFVDIISCLAKRNGIFVYLCNFLVYSKNLKGEMYGEYYLGDENNDVEQLYKLIYFVIIRSKSYKQANSEEEKKKAIQDVFSSDGFCKNLWIALANLRNFGNDSSFSCAEFISSKMIFERAKLNPDGYAKKLSDLLVENNIYISSETKKTKDNNNKEVDQVCTQTDSYEKMKQNAKSELNKHIKKVIDDLENDKNVKYDWVEGTLIYDGKITYDLKKVNFDDNKDNKNDVAEETKQFAGNVLKSYAEDKKLAFYEDKDKKSVFYEFDLNISDDDMQKIQKIVGEKQQAKLKDSFSKFVDEKIANHGQGQPLFQLKDQLICLDVCEKKTWKRDLDLVAVDDLSELMINSFWSGFVENNFYKEEVEIDQNVRKVNKKKIVKFINDEIRKYEEKKNEQEKKQKEVKAEDKKEVKAEDEDKEDNEEKKQSIVTPENTNDKRLNLSNYGDDQSTKNKYSFWIKFFTVLKWIALIGSVLAAIITVIAIFSAAFPVVAGFITTNISWIAPIFTSYIKSAIAAVILGFIYVVSKLAISRLSNGKLKENKYPKQIKILSDLQKRNEFDKTLNEIEGRTESNIIPNTGLKENEKNKQGGTSSTSLQINGLNDK